MLSFCILVMSLTCTHHRPVERAPILPVQKPLYEFRRGMWVRAASVASPDSIPRILEIAHKMKVTDIFVQVVVGGYAYYRSSILPRSQYLSRISEPDYDPLYALSSACAPTPIRVHAWVNALLYWSLETPPDSMNHVFHRYPEWFIRDINNRSMADYAYNEWKNLKLEGHYLDPQNPDVTGFVRDICAEIASKYPIDGIHLDFIRYPGILWGLPNTDGAAVLAGIDAETAMWCNPVKYGRSGLYERWKIWNAWRLTRRRQYTIANLVSVIHKAVQEHALSEECLLSAAVFANPALFKYSLAQDWTDWPEEIFLPVVMSYTPDNTLFNEYAEYALSNRPDALLGIGILWPEMAHAARVQEQDVINLDGAGICYFDFTAIDTMTEMFITPLANVDIEKEIVKIDSSMPLPVDGVFEDLPHPEMINGGSNMATWINALDFTAFLLSLSMNTERDLQRMGLTLNDLLSLIYGDIAAFEYLNSNIFPLGDTLDEPPARKIRYNFIPWAEGDSLLTIRMADQIRSFDTDTLLYPSALDPLARAAFKANMNNMETAHVAAGIYVFAVDTVYGGGRPITRQDVMPYLLPVYLNWTIKNEASRILGNFN